MRLLTFRRPEDGAPAIGVRCGRRVLEIGAAGAIAQLAPLPGSLRGLLAAGPNALARVRELVNAAQEHDSGRFDPAWRDEAQLAYLAPISDADKFLCVGKNYRQHLEELQRTNLIKEIPEEPTAFVKLNSSLVGHRAMVVRPDGIVRLDYEPELVFVIGRRALGVRKVEAFNYVAGVTILNDLTDRDSQEREVKSGSRFWTGKNIPGFGPLGPELITLDEIADPYDLWMTCSVNRQLRMRVNTRDQIWKLPEILEHFSRYIPIEPGDMFSTGSPGGVAVGKENAAELFLKPGDVVECGIEGVATLRTTIVAPPARDAGPISRRKRASPQPPCRSTRMFRSRFPTRRDAALLLAGMLAVAGGAATAQTFPSKTVTIVVPFPPAGGADTLARTLAPRLSALWGQTVVIENRPGASGRIGTEQVANAAADGHTLLMATTAAITEKNIGRLAPVALVSAEPYVVALNANVPIDNVRELIAYAKANPGKLRFGSSGIGAASHLSGELFKAQAHVDMQHVPYKGTGQALTDLLGGQIELMFAPTQTVIPQLQSGRLKAIAVTGTKPLEALPTLPTVAASGLPGYQAQGWFGLLAPKATPPAVIARLHDDVAKVLALPEVRKDLIAKGAEPGDLSAVEFGRFIANEQAKWAKLIKDAGIVME